MILDSNTSDQTMLHSELSAFVTEIEGEKTILQQGDAPIHRTATTKKWFQDFGIVLSSWPGLSSDLKE